MTKNLLNDLGEIFLSDTTISDQVSRLSKQGKIKKLAPKLYTTNLLDTEANIVNKNLWAIVGLLFPGALISDRTALEGRPAKDGSVFIISNKKRPVKVGRITIKPRKGAPALKDDNSFMQGLYFSSLPRALLENMKDSKSINSLVARTLSQSELEDKLDSILREKGVDALNKLRNDMRSIAPKLKLTKEFNQLNKLIGALLQTTEAKLKSPMALARNAGEPYDPKRIELFHKLFNELNLLSPNFIFCDKNLDYTNLYFFEAYFSNFIEGTEFAVDEAHDIVFKNIIPNARSADAHDVTGTYKIVANLNEMRKTPKNFDEFLQLLKARHKVIMDSRAEKNPGAFKTTINRAGNTFFVAPELVQGTLKKGFELHQRLPNAFSKAVFMMFMVSEVHPFTDGNGRIARVMMNAELVANNEQRIIIPTIYRNNYLSALRALSQNGITDAIIKTLAFAQKYTNSIDWSNYEVAMEMLTKTNAFIDPGYADVQGIRLILPGPII
jgi:fido (protein-threonine AMPylation protein)